ncbi:MAG: T9SS type A sorting domain-containing protein [Lewinellaceae bacterium]|nr:T9SS type A sorting domain-containing protein [Saprospiraceae bacterium]MCB9338270.1 T9SS type A sorting domain-containing protein [Lewinellaceae bacterium]
MNGTTISGQKTLIEPYIPNPNDPGCTFSMPHYGLAVQNVQLITIGSTAGQSNTIRDFSFSYNCSGLVTGPFGILVRNTSLTVLNTRFLNIANGTGGRGVDFNVTPGAASKLNLTGLGKNGTPTFDNVQDGVYGLGNMDIRRCHFNNVSWGIYLTGIPAAYQVAIEQNSFENMALESIYEDNSSPIRNLKISNNDFNDNGDSEQIPDIRSGVRLFSFTPGQQATWILNNTFVNSAKQKPFYYDYRGVRIQNINGSLIESNDFTDNFGNIGLLYEGINVFNASTRFWSNTFTGAGNFATHPSTGIQVVESPSCWLNCNTADQTRTGVGFRGMNSDAARFEKNNLNTHQTGLLLRSDAIIGLQTNRHNRWLGNTSNVEALFEGRNPAIPSDLAFVQQSRFFIRHLDPSDYWPTPRLIGTTNDQGQWFMSQSGSTFGVFCINSSEPGGDDAALLTAADTKVMEGTFQSVKGYPAGVWEAKLRLYRRLIENPEMMPVSSTAEAWYLNEQSTTVGRLGNIYHGIYQLSELIQQEQDDLDGAESDYANAIADIQAIDEAISNSIGNPSTIAQLLADRSVEESELSTTTEAYQNLLTNIREVRLENAQDLMEQLGAVSTTAHYETDFKTVCNILLKTYLNDGILGEEDRQILEVIAQQCRYEGGIAVLQARASLVGEWDIEEYDDCQDYLEDRSALQENIAIVGLHPNPASNSALLYLKGEHQHGKATLRNMNGQHIQTWSFEGGSEVRLTWNDKVSNGIYLLEVVTEQNAPQTIKLIIHKD